MARRQETARGSMPLTALLSSKESRAMASLGVRDLDTIMRFAPRRSAVPAPPPALPEVTRGEEVSAVVSVVCGRVRGMRSRPGSIREVTVCDGVEEIVLTFFLARAHQVEWHRGRLPVGARIIVHGTVGYDDY